MSPCKYNKPSSARLLFSLFPAPGLAAGNFRPLLLYPSPSSPKDLVSPGQGRHVQAPNPRAKSPPHGGLTPKLAALCFPPESWGSWRGALRAASCTPIDPRWVHRQARSPREQDPAAQHPKLLAELPPAPSGLNLSLPSAALWPCRLLISHASSTASVRACRGVRGSYFGSWTVFMPRAPEEWPGPVPAVLLGSVLGS